MGLSLHTRTRRRLCLWLAGALLLVQWMVVAHACQTLIAPVHAAPAAAATPAQSHAQAHAEAHAPAVDCHHATSAADEALCKAQCAGEQQVPAQPLTADAQVRVPGWCMVVVVPALQPVAAAGAPFDPVRVGVPPGWPPLYLVHGVLRI